MLAHTAKEDEFNVVEVSFKTNIENNGEKTKHNSLRLNILRDRLKLRL